tara:strand:- start:261 stop:761 length:501 start_codon:yes stop_codon:yes gene_type:complete
MNELMINADGSVICVGDAGSVSGILAELVEANTVRAERDADGVITKEAVVPDAGTLAVEVRDTPLEKDDDGKDIPDSRPLLQTHAWRLPKARTERLEQIRGDRNAKLVELDEEANQALTGRPGVRAVTDVEVARQVLRDLPPVAEAALADLANTDAITAYQPSELE